MQSIFWGGENKFQCSWKSSLLGCYDWSNERAKVQKKNKLNSSYLKAQQFLPGKKQAAIVCLYWEGWGEAAFPTGKLGMGKAEQNPQASEARVGNTSHFLFDMICVVIRWA